MPRHQESEDVAPYRGERHPYGLQSNRSLGTLLLEYSVGCHRAEFVFLVQDELHRYGPVLIATSPTPEAGRRGPTPYLGGGQWLWE